MAASPELAAAWNATPQTKFRTPRVRRDMVARPALLERLCACVDSCPVTLLCAPGGSGKTTLLTQYTTLPNAGFTPLWISLDDEDNDRHQFFATLLRATEPLQLVWEVAPEVLLTNAAGSDSQARAALAAFVNALCTSPARRIVIILDDLHRIDRSDVLMLLESLIERLPDHVALSARLTRRTGVAPGSLARAWRAGRIRTLGSAFHRSRCRYLCRDSLRRYARPGRDS